MKYAEVLLGISQPEEHYTAERIQAMYGKGERTINFKHPIPVYITYQTAFVDDAGKPQARADIYGLDREILEYPARRPPQRRTRPIARNYNSSSKPVTARLGRRHAPPPATRAAGHSGMPPTPATRPIPANGEPGLHSLGLAYRRGPASPTIPDLVAPIRRRALAKMQWPPSLDGGQFR